MSLLSVTFTSFTTRGQSKYYFRHTQNKENQHEFERVKILLPSPFEQGAVTEEALHTWGLVVVGPGGLLDGHCLLAHVGQDEAGAVELVDEGEDLCQLRLVLRDLHHLAQQLQRGLTLCFLLGWRQGLAGVQHVRLAWTDLLESNTSN